MDVEAVIKEAESRIINKYQNSIFFTERDIVWTYQTTIRYRFRVSTEL
jgi:hypothetical protein